jgi:Na+/H+ antiporter NhaD/arsenite permease-like protein
MSSLSLALLIFGVCYLVIITERTHKTIVALFGAAVMIGMGVVSQDEAFYSHEFGVDYNVVFLLIGMMVIINVVRDTGLFEVLAIWAAQRADAQPFRLLVLLSLLTAGLSAMLDNVTTVLLMAPVTLSIAKRLELNPIAFLMTEALASNIGGTATLVGDPPNIMIASKAQLGYLDFLVVLGPIVAVIMALFVGALWVAVGRTMTVAPHLRTAVLGLSLQEAVSDRPFLHRCLWLLGIVNVGFCIHSLIHLEPATIALLGASLFMLIGHARQKSGDGEELSYLTDVEWKTIFFFIGLFILVGGLVKVGVIRYVADQLVALTRGNLAGSTMAVL